MASTILYKFRSGTTFEALPLPGSAARLFDVKKAIVKAKKLDTGTMEFDLAVKNADTNEDYVNESMLLPRGTRLIVQRLPAARGHGFLARMARNEHAGSNTQQNSAHQQQAASGSTPSGFYNIDSRARDDDDEFVQSAAVDAEERELAALQAVTSLRHSDGPAMSGGGFGGGGRGGPQGGPGGAGRGNFKQNFRPNADPELREQERKLMPKKRATGIPRTFLNLSAPPQTDGSKEGEGNENSVPLLQPNTLGFEELVHRGGGQSENTSGTRRDLDYALKLTATSIPDYLQCGICHNVVKNAMLLPWDPEGRTTCETCIRDALTQNGFRCPLTGIDGVSPDDLHPNVGLRKAAELFIKGVMEKFDEIVKQQVDEAEDMAGENGGLSGAGNVLEGDGTEKGVLVSNKKISMKKKSSDDDPFGGGDDDFGGDVFAVEADKPIEEDIGEDNAPKDDEANNVANKSNTEPPETESTKESDSHVQDNDGSNEDLKNKAEESENRNDKDLQISTLTRNDETADLATPSSEKQQETPSLRDRREQRRRGPPVGYAMGPAGGAVGAVGGPTERSNRDDQQPNGGYRGGGAAGGRGRGRGGYQSPSGGGGRDGIGGRDGAGGRDSGMGSFQGGSYQDRAPFRGRGRGGRGRGRFGGRGDMEMDGGGAGRVASHHEGGNRGGSPHQFVSFAFMLSLLLRCDM
jgi:hypothetical protein